ncbi:MAG: hypothetical protein NTAFB01_28550 [Nitrospira sp.]
MFTNDLQLNLIDLCHSYGIGGAPKTLCPLSERAEDDWSWFINATRLTSPAELLLRHLASRGDLKLQYSLDLIESQRELGIRARCVVLNWLLFHGMLEIGIRSGVIGQELPESFVNSAKQEFSVVQERFWTEVDLTLLSELQRRLSGGVTRQIDATPEARDLFQRFVILNSSIRSDPSLGLISDFTKIDFSSYRAELHDALEAPSNFVATFTTLSPEKNNVKRVLLGLSRCFYFFPELFNLIEVAGQANPYLAESIRSYNRYWTDLLSSETGEKTLSTVFDAFERWAVNAADEESREEIRSMRNVIWTFQLQYA